MTTKTDKSVQQVPGGGLPRTKTPESLFWLIEDLLFAEEYERFAVFYDGSGFADYIKEKWNVQIVGNETNNGSFSRIYAFPPFYQKVAGNKETSNVRLVQNVQRGAEDRTEDLIQKVLDSIEVSIYEGIGVIMVSNSLFNRNYARLQKKLVESRLLTKIINLPFGAVYPKNISASLLVFIRDCGFDANEGIRFVDLRAFASGQINWTESQKTFAQLSDHDIELVESVISSDGEYSKFVTYEEIAKADYNLNSNFYLGKASVADVHKPFVLGDEAQIFRGAKENQVIYNLLSMEDYLFHEDYGSVLSEVKYLRITDIEDNSIQDTMPNIEIVEDLVEPKFYLCEKDIVISKIAVPMKFALANEKDVKNAVLPAGNIFIIRMNEGSELNPYYLKSYMDSVEGKAKLLSLSSGSSLVSFTKDSLKRFEIPYMSPTAQAELAKEYILYEKEIKRIEGDLSKAKKAQLDLYNRFVPSGISRRAPDPDQALPPSLPAPAPGQMAPQAGGQSESPQTSDGEAGPKSPA